MMQTSPERVQAGPEIGEQDRPEIADGQDVPRVYVVAGEQDGGHEQQWNGQWR